jgi:hypothetical protein
MTEIPLLISLLAGATVLINAHATDIPNITKNYSVGKKNGRSVSKMSVYCNDTV